MSFPAVKWALAQKLERSGAKLLLITLADYADDDGKCFPSRKKLAEDTGLAESSIKNHLNWLEESGLLERLADFRRDGSQTANRYRLAMPVPPGQNLAPPGQNLAPGGQKPDGEGPNSGPLEPITESFVSTETARAGARATSPDGFEDFWRGYGRRENASKPKTLAEWCRLTPEQRQTALAVLPRYMAWLAGKPPDWPVPSPATWLRERRFETWAEEPAAKPKRTSLKPGWVEIEPGTAEFRAWVAHCRREGREDLAADMERAAASGQGRFQVPERFPPDAGPAGRRGPELGSARASP